MSFNLVNAQMINDNVNLDINSSSNEENVTNEIRYFGFNNLSDAANRYEEIQRLETGPPSKIIDQEEFEDESIEKLKEDIERLESSAPPGNVTTFDLKNLLDSTVTQNATAINPSKLESPKNSSDPNQSKTSQPINLNKYSLKKWEGLNVVTASIPQGGYVPPDITLAVGTDDVVQMVHSAMRVWDKNGNEKLNVFLSDFFGIKDPYRLADPIVLYDISSERWFSVIMEYSPQTVNGVKEKCHSDCFLRVAVSTDSDPSKAWKIYRISFGKSFADYPVVGASNDKLAIGVNIFPNNEEEEISGTQAVIIDKNDLLKNSTSISSYFTSVFPNYYTITPVTSPTECLYLEANDWSRVTPTREMDGIVLFKACGNPSNNLNLSKEEIQIPRLLLPIDGVQPNYLRSETDSAIMRSPVFVNNTIISGVNYTCDAGGEFQNCIGLLKINVDTTSSFEDFRGLSPGGNYHIFYPAIGLNKDGDLAMLYGLSSIEEYPSLFVMVLDQKFNILYNSLLVRGDGNTSFFSGFDRNGMRFGDYFTASTDPVDRSVWMSGEYGNKDIKKSWSTYVGNIS